MPPAVVCRAYVDAAEVSVHRSPPILRPQQWRPGRPPVCSGHQAEGCGGRTADGSAACWVRSGSLWLARRPGRSRWPPPSPGGRMQRCSNTGRHLEVLLNGFSTILTLAASITSNSTTSPSPTLRRNFLGLFFLIAVWGRRIEHQTKWHIIFFSFFLNIHTQMCFTLPDGQIHLLWYHSFEK